MKYGYLLLLRRRLPGLQAANRNPNPVIPRIASRGQDHADRMVASLPAPAAEGLDNRPPPYPTRAGEIGC